MGTMRSAPGGRYAVFDFGSTSFQLLVVQVEPDGTMTPIVRDRVILNIGVDVAATGHVSEELLDRAMAVARRFRNLAERYDVDATLPVATAAFRDAVNRPNLARAMRSAIGQPVRVLSGDLEARSTVAGIMRSVALDPSAWLAFDLGGGSLEIAAVLDGRVRWTDSYPLGAARITRTMVGGDPVVRRERRHIQRVTRDLLGPIVERANVPVDAPCVLAGGTAGALARLLAAERWPVPPSSLNQFEMTTADLSSLARSLCAADLEERLAMPGIDRRRAEILPAGAVVLATALSAFGIERAVHSEWGLREGVVIRELGIDPPASLDALREASIAHLARRWKTEGAHPERVRHLALQLFDGLVELSALGGQERELLDHAAAVHDVGVRISLDKHHRHGAYLVEHGGLRGFSPTEIAMIASMVRFHRGSGPKSNYPPFAGLSDEEREACQILTGILRVAHALDRSEGELEVRVEVQRKDIVVHASGATMQEATLAAASERSLDLSDALGRNIRFAGRAVTDTAEHHQSTNL